MKVLHFLFLLMCVNLAITLLNASGIWVIGTDAGQYAIEGATVADIEGSWLTKILSIGVVGLVSALIAAAAASYFSPQGISAVVFGLFSGAFWSVYISSMMAITDIVDYITGNLPEVSSIMTIFTGIFSVIIIGLFVVGLMQLAQQPMGGME